VTSLAGLVGAHPAALRGMFTEARPTDPAELGDAPRGRILAVEPLQDVFMLTRPLQRLLGSGRFPWTGKVFDHGGNSGQNVMFGKKAARFRSEVAASDLDGGPALVFHYDDPGFKNPWPISAVRGELRTISEGVAIGALTVASRKGTRHVVLWWGLETPPPAAK
jgi:hypothetical protein